MSKFDELLDDVLSKAKEAADIAGKKTNEMVELGKLKYKAKQLSWDIEKTYAKLGALVYESHKSGESFQDVQDLVLGELDELNGKLDKLEARIAGFKAQSAAESAVNAAHEEAPASNDEDD